MPPYHLRAVNGTLFVEHDGSRRDHSRLGDLANIAALGITGTAQELTKAATLQLHWFAAQFTRLRLFRFHICRTISRSCITIAAGSGDEIARGVTIQTLEIRSEEHTS